MIGGRREKGVVKRRTGFPIGSEYMPDTDSPKHRGEKQKEASGGQEKLEGKKNKKRKGGSNASTAEAGGADGRTHYKRRANKVRNFGATETDHRNKIKSHSMTTRTALAS